MGKIITFITILIFVDLLFLATGQLFLDDNKTQSVGSIIFNAILNPKDLTGAAFFKAVIGDITQLFNSTGGILAAGTATGILAAAFLIKSENLAFIPIGVTLSLLANDFIVITSFLVSKNQILGLFIMAPIIIIFVMSCLEWVRNKD